MKNSLSTLTIIGVLFLGLVLGCGGTNQNSTAVKSDNTAVVTSSNTATGEAAPSEKPIAVQAKTLTKEYDDNELAADGKYKGKVLTVSGKISNIAETFGNVTAQLEGHNAVMSVMCNFEESEKPNVMKLKKGQTATLIGTNDGSTGGLYVGLQKCKIQ